MNLCSWCPERHDTDIRDHKKSGQIAMSRHTNSHHIYCPQQMRAMSACFGLKQGDLESEYNTPFLSSLFFLFFSFLPIDLRLTCVCVVIGTTRYLCRRSLLFMIVLYRRLLWRTGDIVKKIPISLYYRLIPGERDDIFKKIPIFFIILSSVNRWRTRCIDQQQQPQQSVASAIIATTQQSVRNTTTLMITPTFRSASTFRLWG